jgi:hypothetical protein
MGMHVEHSRQQVVTLKVDNVVAVQIDSSRRKPFDAAIADEHGQPVADAIPSAVEYVAVDQRYGPISGANCASSQ